MEENYLRENDHISVCRDDTVSDFVQYCVLILNSKQMFAATHIIGVYVHTCICVCVCVCIRALGTPVGVRNYRGVRILQRRNFIFLRCEKRRT